MEHLKVYHWTGYRDTQTSEFVAAASKAEAVRLANATLQFDIRVADVIAIANPRISAIARHFPRKIFRCRKAVEHQTDAQYFCEGESKGKTLAEWLGSFEQPAEGALMRKLRTEAVIELMRESRTERQSVTAYQRVRRAIKTLDIDEHQVLHWLEYHEKDGSVRPWLASKLAKEAK